MAAPFCIAIVFLAAAVSTARRVVGWFIDPLRKVPGPRIASLTDIWRLRNALSGREEVINLELHEKYGKNALPQESQLSLIPSAQGQTF